MENKTDVEYRYQQMQEKGSSYKLWSEKINEQSQDPEANMAEAYARHIKK
jgi:hypothetical protein